MPDEPGGQPRIVRKRGLHNFMFMPILDAEDGYGLTYGARVAFVGIARGAQPAVVAAHVGRVQARGPRVRAHVLGRGR